MVPVTRQRTGSQVNPYAKIIGEKEGCVQQVPTLLTRSPPSPREYILLHKLKWKMKGQWYELINDINAAVTPELNIFGVDASCWRLCRRIHVFDVPYM